MCVRLPPVHQREQPCVSSFPLPLRLLPLPCDPTPALQPHPLSHSQPDPAHEREPCNISLSEPGLFPLTRCSPAPSISLQTAQFHRSFLQPNGRPLCLHTAFSSSVHVGPLGCFPSWLWVEPQSGQKWKCGGLCGGSFACAPDSSRAGSNGSCSSVFGEISMLALMATVPANIPISSAKAPSPLSSQELWILDTVSA